MSLLALPTSVVMRILDCLNASEASALAQTCRVLNFCANVALEADAAWRGRVLNDYGGSELVSGVDFRRDEHFRELWWDNARSLLQEEDLFAIRVRM